MSRQVARRLAVTAGATPASASMKAFGLSSGTAEAVKWLAFALMVGDHLNKYLWHEAHPALFGAGRLVMPLFAYVLASNLAKLTQGRHSAYRRVMLRLALAGSVACVPFMGLGGLVAAWYPLNVMFMLLVGVAVIALWDGGSTQQRVLAVAVFVFGGALVEFWWPGVAVVITSSGLVRRPGMLAIGAWLASLASLGLINGNAWAFAIVPLLLVCIRIDLPVARCRGLFYALYPVHLALLWWFVQPLPNIPLR